MKKYLDLFFIFCRISLFTLGGGLAMLPLLKREVVDNRRWISQEEFLDIWSISQSMPGMIILNFATTIGYKIAGTLGSLYAAVGTVVPPFMVIVLVAMFFFDIKDNLAVERVFSGIRPAVIALIVFPMIELAKSAGINKKTIAIPLAIIVASTVWRIHPIYIILLGMIASSIWAIIRKT